MVKYFITGLLDKLHPLKDKYVVITDEYLDNNVIQYEVMIINNTNKYI